MSENRRIPLSEPFLAGNERLYVNQCIDENFVSSVGAFVDRFELAVAQFTGSRFGVAAVNGTAALHISLLVAGIQPDDEVLVSDLTFIAPVNAIRYVGAWPVLIDAEPRYMQMDPERVEEFVTRQCDWRAGELRNRATGRRVRGIIPVHILGHPCDLDPIMEIARRHNLVVIEDATESLGAKYKGKMAGTYGALACFSFNGNKIITTGGGGMIVTDDETLARRSKYLTTQAKDDPVEYVHNEIGYNYRLTNLLAAVGVAQMEQLPGFVQRKRYIGARYAEMLHDLPGVTPMAEAEWADSNFWLYTIRIDESRFGMTSRAVMVKLAEYGIQSRPLWRPMHMLPVHAGSPSSLKGVSATLYGEALSIPCSLGTSDEDFRRVAKALKELHSANAV